MQTPAETFSEPSGGSAARSLDKTLQQQVAEAVADRALPISRLLRLMWALDADHSPANQNLRAQLRARIGAPPSA